jgi:hypothetical protein
MSKLTTEQKKIVLSLLKLEGDYNVFIQEESYGDTPAYKAINKWISETLDCDFETEIYYNKEMTAKNLSSLIKDVFSSKYKSWFIGDVLTNCIYSKTKNSPTDEDIQQIDESLKEAWGFFKNLLNSDSYEYEPVDIQMNGEVLYRRVTK